MTAISSRLSESTRLIKERAGARADIKIGVVLGSGLGGMADKLEDAVAIDYREIPHFPVSTTSGHAGRLLLGTLGGARCAVLQGRVHHYEGHAAAAVVFPVRTLISLGARIIMLTNAAGGINFPAGSLMLLRDHIHLIPDHPLRGENDDALGTRFPDMTTAYDPELRALVKTAARRSAVDLVEGVYISLPGPAYETPAEIKMAKIIGADAVGMSTTSEVIAAVHMGARVIGISCISNAAAGLSDKPLSHDEVKETAERVGPQFEKLLLSVLTDLATKESL